MSPGPLDDALRAAGLHTLGDDPAPETMQAVIGNLLEIGEAAGAGGVSGSKAERAVAYAIAAGASPWHDPDGEPYIDVRGERGERRTLAVRSRTCREWLRSLVYKEEEGALGGTAANDAVELLAAQAVHDGPEHRVHVRTAEHHGAIYIDLGDDTWRAIRVTEYDWDVVAEPPVRFRRARGMRALPEPQRGGNLDGLRQLLNLAADTADRDWILVVAWLVGALRGSGPYPVANLVGEAGSAKTTTGRMLRHVVDPNQAAMRGPPREDRDLVIAANNSHVVAYDNLSSLRDWLSDALCRIATGDAWATRELYTDKEEVIFAGARPIILAGIEDVVTRGDLADRAIPIRLGRIPDDKRRTERELWQAIDDVRPGVLGALLDAMVVGLSRRHAVKLDRMPRMADFAEWVVACEPALPWEPGAFLPIYERAQRELVVSGIDADPVAAAVLEFVVHKRDWAGNAGELLKAIDARRDDVRRPKGWPETPRGMQSRLARNAGALRLAGVELEGPDRKRRYRLRYEKPLDRGDRGDGDKIAQGADAGRLGSAPGVAEPGSNRGAESPSSKTVELGSPGRPGTAPPRTAVVDQADLPTLWEEYEAAERAALQEPDEPPGMAL